MTPAKQIGVAIPSYNRENYLRILLSTIPEDIEVVVSDNGNHYPAKFRNEFRQCNFIGTDEVIDVIRNWNAAASQLTSEWVCVASDDDMFHPNAFQVVRGYIDQYPDAEVFVFGHQNIDEHAKEINTWKVDKLTVAEAPNGYELFKYGVDARVIGIFFKRDLYHRIGKFDETYKVTAADSDFIQLALLSAKSVFVPEILMGYRVWSKSMTGQLMTTLDWHKEVRYWQDKIAKQLASMHFKPATIARNTQEVIARNLLAGLVSIRKKKGNLSDSMKLLFHYPYPVSATVETHSRILKCLLKIGLKI